MQLLVSWIEEQVDPNRKAKGRNPTPILPMMQTGVLSQWVGSLPLPAPHLVPAQSISAATALPSALVLAPPSAPPSGQAKKVAKRAVEVITNGGLRGAAGRISVLTAQLSDPLIRPLLQHALPREIRAKVQIVDQEKAISVDHCRWDPCPKESLRFPRE